MIHSAKCSMSARRSHIPRRIVHDAPSLVTYASRAICVIYLVFYILIDVKHSYALTLAVLGSITLRILLSGKAGSFLFVSYLAIIYLYIPTTLGMFLDGYRDPLPFLALTVLGLDFADHFSRTGLSRSRWRNPTAPSDPLIWATCLVLASIGTLLFAGKGQFLDLFSFTIPYAVSLIYFERLLPQSSLMRLYSMISAYLIVVGVYTAHFWGGFGRIVIGAYVLMPVLIANQHRDFGLRPWQALAIAPPLLLVAHYSRSTEWVATSDLGGGSAGHHIVLTMDLLENSVYEYLGGLSKFFDQYVLLFLNWVPRETWPQKPIGIGLYAVDEWIGRRGYPEGFNVSLGMFGEQLYLTGPYFLMAWFLMLATLVALRRMVGKLSNGYIAPVVAFDVNLISYIWGGAASFGSRAWFFIVPMLAMITVWNSLEGKRAGRHVARRLSACRRAPRNK